jgi:uncharacterized protein involved in response to NO
MGTTAIVLAFVGLLLLLGGLALPEGATSTAIHVLAIGCFAGAFVLMVRDFAQRERGRRS